MTEQQGLPAPTFVTVDGVEIATYVLDGPTDPIADVVLCHGTPWSAEVWRELAGTLSAHCRVFLWDMPGYGRSTKDPAVAVDLASQMSRFAQLLEHWQLDRPHVVAHDIGGAVALGAHLLHGRDYAGLYLWDVVTLDPWGSPFFGLVADHADVFAALPGNLHAALVNEYIAGAAGHELAPEWVRALTQPWLGDEGQSAFYRQIAALRPHHTHPLVERLHQSRCPVAIGWGEQDPWIPVEQATRLQRSLPDAPSPLTLSGVGHLAPIEAPARVRSALDAWLAADGPPRRSTAG
jgi:pimeloyl-ACP methyl ester carboxylesterase